MRPHLLLAVLSGCVYISPAEPDAFPADLHRTLDRLLIEELGKLDAPGATLGVRLPDGRRWLGAAGSTTPEGHTPMPLEGRFRVGSITKTYHAAAALKLHSEGTLPLQSTIGDLLPELDGPPGFADITVLQLLSHQSGVPNYTELTYFLTQYDQPHTPEEVIALSLEGGLRFEPGTDAAYSNTNYYILARMIEATTGQPIHEVLRGRVLDPLGLDETYLEGPESRPDGIVPGFLNRTPMQALDPSWHWAAGGMAAPIDELITWGHALLASGGDALTQEERLLLFEELAETSDAPTFAYGLGLQHNQTSCGIVRGHMGSTMGFQSDLFRTETGVIVGVLVNDFTREASDIAWAACEAVDAWIGGDASE